MNPFWMIRADLKKTLVSSLGILVLLALAFSSTVAVSLLERSVRTAGAASAQDFDLVVGAPGSRLDLVLTSVYLRTDEVLPLLPAEVVTTLALDARVAAVSALVLADNHLGFPIVGVSPDFPKLRPSLRLASGRWPDANFEAVSGAQTGLVVGAEFHGSHGESEPETHAGEPADEHDAHDEVAYHVVGTLAATGTPWDRAFVTPLEGIWNLHGDTEHAVTSVLVKPKDFASAYSLRAQYREGETTAAFPGEVLAGLFGVFDQVKTALSLAALVVQSLVFAAVLLSLLAALPTKARWIGLLRALGAGRAYVFLVLWLQTALVFLAAAVVGGLAGWFGSAALAAYLADQSGLVLTLRWTWVETGWLMGFWCAGLLGALVPAVAGYRASARRVLLGQ